DVKKEEKRQEPGRDSPARTCPSLCLHGSHGYAGPRLYHRAESPDDLLQTRGDLPQRADFGRFEQRGKTILVSLDNGCELIERLLSFTRVPRFELFQPIDLQLLLRPRRTRELHF